MCDDIETRCILGDKTLINQIYCRSFGSWIVYSQHFNFFHGGITHQITLYCFSRVVLALSKILLDKYLNCFQPGFRNYQGELIHYKDLNNQQQKKLKILFIINCGNTLPY